MLWVNKHWCPNLVAAQVVERERARGVRLLWRVAVRCEQHIQQPVARTQRALVLAEVVKWQRAEVVCVRHRLGVDLEELLEQWLRELPHEAKMVQRQRAVGFRLRRELRCALERVT